MMHEQMRKNIVEGEYLNFSLSSPSSGIDKADIAELLNELLSFNPSTSGTQRFAPMLLPLFYLLEIDHSSVLPRLEPKNETFVEEVSEQMIMERMIKHDFIVKMPPVSEYTIKVRVKSIEQAIPHILTPEEF